MRCCIVDANIVGVAFGDDPPPAGVALFRWMQFGEGRLIVGGKLAEELRVTQVLNRRPTEFSQKAVNKFSEWLRLAWQNGRVRNLDLQPDAKRAIRTRTEALRIEAKLRSDDPHVIALAIESGARLLYSHDRLLQQDFGDATLIDNPRGKVYSTAVNHNLTAAHRRLMREASPCG